MIRSDSRILTTNTGSVPRAPELVDIFKLAALRDGAALATKRLFG